MIFLPRKWRPAVCLTNPIGTYRRIVVAFITSGIPEDLSKTDIVIRADQPDFSLSGLRVSSTIQLHRLMTINVSLIQRELGMLPTSFHEEVRQKLGELFLL